MRTRIGTALALATAAWVIGPLAPAAPAATTEGFAPTSIRLVSPRVGENQPAGTTVGRVVVRDRDRGRHTIALVSGRGSRDNDAVRVAGLRLLTSRPLDHETRPVLRIRLRATDEDGHRITRAVRVEVTDRDDAPTAVDDTADVTEDAAATTLDVLANDTDVDGGPMRIRSVTQPDHGDVEISADGSGVTYTPAPDQCDPAGSEEFRYTLAPGAATAAVRVTVSCVEDPPTAVDDTRVAVEDVPLDLPATGPDSPAGNDTDPDGDPLVVAGVSRAVGGEAAMTAEGSLRFTPAPDRCGSHAGSFDYLVSDGRGGHDTGTVSIDITCVDDGPAVTGDTATVAEDSGATPIPVLANDRAGDDGAPVRITSVTQPAHGTVVVTGGGTGLTYTPDPDFCTGAGPAETFTYTIAGGLTAEVSVVVTCTPEPPVAADAAFAGVGNTSLVVDDPTDGAPDPVGPQKTVTRDLLAAATDPDDDAESLSLVPVTGAATSAGGRVTIEADGDLTYLPPRGCGDTADTFDYTVTDGTLTDTATVTVTLSDCVWYVDATAASPEPGTAGTSQAPYPDLDALDAADGAGDADRPGDLIFLGAGTYPTVAGLALEDDQAVYTARSGLDVAGTTLLPRDPARERSTIVGGLRAAVDNTVQGLDLGSASGYALTGSGVGTLTVNTETGGDIENPDGGAVSIRGPETVLDVELGSVETDGAGLLLSDAAGHLVVHGGRLAGPSGAPVVDVSGGTLDLSLGADVEGTEAVRIMNSGDGVRDFRGRVSGGTVYLQSNGGQTRFEGGLNLADDAGGALVAASAGTLAVIDPPGPGNNTLESTLGALVMSSTTIAADGMTFERISSVGATNGIGLSGTAGGALIVTGTDSPCADRTDACAGGVIANSTGSGVFLDNVHNVVRLQQMRVEGSAGDGIRALNGTTGVDLRDSVVADNGNGPEDHGIALEDVQGAASVADSTLVSNQDDNLWVVQHGGALSLSVDRTTLDGAAGGIIVDADGGAVDAVVDGTRMAGNTGPGLSVLASGTATVDLTVRDSDVRDRDQAHRAGASQIQLSPEDRATVRALLENVTLADSNGDGVDVSATGSAVLDATVRGSTVLAPAGAGITDHSVDGTVRLTVDATTITGYGTYGLDLFHAGPGGGTGRASYVVTRSTLSQPDPTANDGITLRVGQDDADPATVCASIGGLGLENDLGGGGAAGMPDVRISTRPAATLLLPGWTGDATTYVQGRNTGTPDVLATLAGATSATQTCDTAQLPAP